MPRSTDTTYNDGGVTPAVHQTYNRSGQLWKVRDGTSSSATDYVEFIYNGTRPYLLDAVDYGTFYGSRAATQVYDSVFRPRGFTLGSATSLAADLAQTYTYDASDGRIATVSSSRNNDAGTNRTFTYGYKADSSLIETVTSGSYQVTRTYEAKRDLLTSQTTTWGGVARTRYDYHYNQLAQRDAAAQSGDAFADLGLPTFHRYIYNERGELSDATNYLGDESAGYAARSLGTTSFPQLPGRHHLYGYDAIGNRTSASRTGTAGAPEIFTANKLNQYVSRENNYVHTAGTVADSSVKVAVGGGTSASGIGRLGRYWDAQVPVANIGQPWFGSLTVYAAQLGGAPNGGDLVHTETRSVQVAPAVQVFQYDDDGNLTHDRMWKYQWDAENRLVRMEPTDEAIAAHLPRRVLEFTYDYLGRRVRKIVTTLHETTGAFVGDPDCRRFLYDEWNLIAEFKSTSASTLGVLARSYLWGLDLTGSRTASGGIGALLQITDHGASPVKTWLPTFDGNGNIAAYLDGVTGAVAAAYEYSPFGEPLRADAPDILAAELPFRFSTKFVDLETGLAYYGHRYFSPTLGRFINKDPIAELGGLNLYGFCNNEGIGRWDYLGNADGLRVGRPDKMAEDYKGMADRFRSLLLENNGDIRAALNQFDSETGKAHMVSITRPNGSTTSYLSEIKTSGAASVGDTARVAVAVAQKVSRGMSPTGSILLGMVDRGIAVGQMTGSFSAGVQAVANPVLRALISASENIEGRSLDPDSPQRELEFWERVLSGLSAEVEIIGLYGFAGASAKVISPYFAIFKGSPKTGVPLRLLGGATDGGEFIDDIPFSRAAEKTTLNPAFQKGFASHSELVSYLGPAGKGRAWHHIVEQTPANIAKFGPERIHNINNIVNVPHGSGTLHSKLSGFYSSLAPGGGRIRDWVSTKSFDEQYNFGTKTLERFFKAEP